MSDTSKPDGLDWIMHAGNTWDSCLLALRRRGYTIGKEVEGTFTLFLAWKGDRGLAAHNPAELLGLASMYETLGDEWLKDVPDILAELRSSSKPLPPVPND